MSQRPTTRAVLESLSRARAADQVVITNQGSARVWPELPPHPLDFHFLPSAMGAAIGFGLGIALAHPQREVLVVSGDGSLLMNLGTLVTVAASGATNLTVVVLDNAAYAVTGIQQTAASDLELDFAALAQSCGFRTTQRYTTESTWASAPHSWCDLPGPRLIAVSVPAEHHQSRSPLAPIRERLDQFQQQLRS